MDTIFFQDKFFHAFVGVDVDRSVYTSIEARDQSQMSSSLDLSQKAEKPSDVIFKKAVHLF